MTNEELVTKIKAGENGLMDQLWEQCYGFIRQQAMRWARAWESRPDFDADDLTQAGYMALCDAVSGFQKDKGGFLAFLSFHLKTEFAKVAGCRTEAQLKEPLNCAMSLDAPAFDDKDNDTTIGDKIPVNDIGFVTVEDSIYRRQMSDIIRDAVESIPEQQSKGIELYFLQGKTQKETADRLCVSGSRAQQVIKEGLQSLRKSSFLPALTEVYYCDQNFFKGTGFSSYKYSGSSSVERAVIKKDNIEDQYKKSTWGGKVSMLINMFGYSVEKAQVIATLDSVSA